MRDDIQKAMEAYYTNRMHNYQTPIVTVLDSAARQIICCTTNLKIMNANSVRWVTAAQLGQQLGHTNGRHAICPEADIPYRGFCSRFQTDLLTEIFPSPYSTNLQFLLKAQLLWVPSAFFAEILHKPLMFSHHGGLLFTSVGKGITLARALLHLCSPFSGRFEGGHSCLGGSSFFGCKPKRKISRGHFQNSP
jgi:hypothetical protein